MIDPYVFDQIEDEEAYEARKRQHKKNLKNVLGVMAMVRTLCGDDAFYNLDDYDDWEDEIYED